MTRLRVSVIAVAVLVMVGCHGRESITGGYGNRVVVGQVAMAAGMPNGSPAGVRVTVGATGMSAVLDASGSFTFLNVPDTADFHFTRGEDGIDAHLQVAESVGPLSIVLSTKSARIGRQRAVPPTSGLKEYEGVVTAISDTEITVNGVTFKITPETQIRKGHQPLSAASVKTGDRVHIMAKGDTAVLIILQNPEEARELEGTVSAISATEITVNGVTLKITPDTIIRKGNQTLTAADVKVGDHVHVKANGDTALQIIVQGGDDDDDGETEDATMTANGLVTATSATGLTVATEAHGDVTVNVDSSTIIRKQGAHITLADIKVGDQVNTMGKRVDDHTEQARQIEVRGVSGHH